MLRVMRRGLTTCVVGAFFSLLAQDSTAELKFASDQVASIAKAPAATEAIEARQKLDQAIAAQNAEECSQLVTNDLVVHTPANRVANKEAVLGYLKSGRIDYEDATTTIEGLSVRSDHVVIMGEEVVTPQNATDNAGKTVRRRFTDVWRKEPDGKWRLTIRQATVTAIE